MKKKKVMSLFLASAMAFGLAACGSNANSANGEASGTEAPETSGEAGETSAETEAATSEEAEPAESVVKALEGKEYDDASTYLYEHNLGDFYEIYQKALSEDNTIAERYALMASAEAKLLESGVMLPTYSKGGLYAISNYAPYTNSPILWGNDNERFHNRLITTEAIKASDRAEMKAKYVELQGTGTYEQYVKDFLAEKGYTLKDTLNMTYVSDPKTWDVLATSRSADSEAIVNTFDGLMEYDDEKVLQPALAESYEVSDDGLTYTFKLRQGVKWVDSQGREVADVCADDFVAGMQHMMDAQGGLEYLVQGVIENANEYIGGDITDFSQVGVKAVDDYTVEYTLTAPCPYFMTMLSYGVFAPMSRTYYESQGGKFGAEYDPEAVYGTDPDHIAYCGPYLVTNATEKNTIVFKANPSYWNADNINVHTITWLYTDGTDPTKTYNDYKDGVLDGVNLNTSTLELAKADGLFDDYAYLTDTDATSYMAYLTVYRTAYANVNDE